MSPSTLSRLVSRIETELGAVLLERDTRTVTLTSQGKTFLAFALESLRNRDELRLGLAASEKSFSGTLKIFASVTALLHHPSALHQGPRRTLPPDPALGGDRGPG